MRLLRLEVWKENVGLSLPIVYFVACDSCGPFAAWGLKVSSAETLCLSSGLGTISVGWLSGEKEQAWSACE